MERTGMKTVRALAAWCVLAFTLLLVVMGRADAYLDPGTGSFLIQLLIAGVLGAGFAVKMFWRRITGFVGGLFGRKSDSSQEPDGPPAAGDAERPDEGEGGGR
jgi:hypothetical protein